MRFLHFLFLALLVPSALSAQLKFERESRLRESEVPAKALSFIQDAMLDTKIKWYYEENLEGNSVEAKFRLNKVKYSVEFDTLGMIQDIEVAMDEDQLYPPVRSRIETGLSQQFSRHQWRKLQQQFSGSELELLAMLKEVGTGEELTLRYEAEIKGKDENGTILYEMTFDHQGQLLQQREIIFRNANHLEY